MSKSQLLKRDWSEVMRTHGCESLRKPWRKQRGSTADAPDRLPMPRDLRVPTGGSDAEAGTT
eukprot:6039091-Prymnesium_polylepis.1